MRWKNHRPMRPCRYNVDQVLRGMQAFVTENCGPQVVLEPDTPLHDYHDAAAKSHECPLLFLSDLAEHFGLEWGESRWIVWLHLRDRQTMTARERDAAWYAWLSDVSPTLTVRTLAQYIASRARGQSLAPATVLGVPCAKAGVFLGICDMPEVAGLRIAPSTPLSTLVSAARIRKLWNRVEWVSGVALPPAITPRPLRFAHRADWLATCAWIASFVASAAVATLLVPGGHYLATAVVAAMTWGIGLLATMTAVDRNYNPMPAGMGTFGDLARLVADGRQGYTT